MIHDIDIREGEQSMGEQVRVAVCSRFAQER
jgi:hypothetical protein